MLMHKSSTLSALAWWPSLSPVAAAARSSSPNGYHDEFVRLAASPATRSFSHRQRLGRRERSSSTEKAGRSTSSRAPARRTCRAPTRAVAPPSWPDLLASRRDCRPRRRGSGLTRSLLGTHEAPTARRIRRTTATSCTSTPATPAGPRRTARGSRASAGRGTCSAPPAIRSSRARRRRLNRFGWACVGTGMRRFAALSVIGLGAVALAGCGGGSKAPTTTTTGSAQESGDELQRRQRLRRRERRRRREGPHRLHPHEHREEERAVRRCERLHRRSGPTSRFPTALQPRPPGAGSTPRSSAR